MREKSETIATTRIYSGESVLPAAENDALHRELAGQEIGRLAIKLEMDSAARGPKLSSDDVPGFERIGPAAGDPPHIIRGVN